VVLFHGQLVNPEAELLRDRAKRRMHPRPDLGVREHAPALRAPDQMVLAVVLRMLLERQPMRDSVMNSHATKGQDKGDLRPPL